MNLSTNDITQLSKALREAQDMMIAEMQKNFILLSQNDEAGEIWYTVQVQNREIWFWLTQQEGRWSHNSERRNAPVAIMEEKVYLALVMRWS